MQNIQKFIETKLSKAVELKEKFKVLEKKDWNSLTVLLELNVQLSHVYNVLYNDDSVNEINRSINNLGDELSDVLLQLSYLSHLENVDFTKINNYLNYSNSNINSLSILFGQLTECLLEKYDYRFNKRRDGFNSNQEFIEDRLLKMFMIVSNIADANNIDILKEFDLMYDDAQAFIKKSIEV